MYTLSLPSGTLRLNGEIVPYNSPEYASWLKAGNGPTEVQDEPVVPRIEVSAWQIRKALNATALRQQVEDAVAASTNVEMKDGWNYAPTFYSDNALTLSLGAGLGKTTAEMYDLFKLASTL